jgi:hypothetical protein
MAPLLFVTPTVDRSAAPSAEPAIAPQELHSEMAGRVVHEVRDGIFAHLETL